MKLLSCLVKLLNKQGGGCGFDLDTLFERMWSHSKFIPVMCQSHDQEEDNESTETLKGEHVTGESVYYQLELNFQSV